MTSIREDIQVASLYSLNSEQHGIHAKELMSLLSLSNKYGPDYTLDGLISIISNKIQEIESSISKVAGTVSNTDLSETLNLPKTLFKLMKEEHLSIKELALKTQLSQDQLNAALSGSASGPVYENLCTFFNLDKHVYKAFIEQKVG